MYENYFFSENCFEKQGFLKVRYFGYAPIGIERGFLCLSTGKGGENPSPPLTRNVVTSPSVNCQ